jgi:hypothetical protein
MPRKRRESPTSSPCVGEWTKATLIVYPIYALNGKFDSSSPLAREIVDCPGA